MGSGTWDKDPIPPARDSGDENRLLFAADSMGYGGFWGCFELAPDVECSCRKLKRRYSFGMMSAHFASRQETSARAIG